MWQKMPRRMSVDKFDSLFYNYSNSNIYKNVKERRNETKDVFLFFKDAKKN
jgi:hypothetical protein